MMTSSCDDGCGVIGVMIVMVMIIDDVGVVMMVMTSDDR